MSSADVTPAGESPEGKRRRRIRLPYILLLALMALFAYKFVEKTRDVQGLAAEANALRVENQQFQQQNTRIKQKLPYYQSNAYVIEAARGLLGYALPGDTLVQTNPVQQRVIPVHRAAPPPPSTAKPIWQQWWDSFFG